MPPRRTFAARLHQCSHCLGYVGRGHIIGSVDPTPADAHHSPASSAPDLAMLFLTPRMLLRWNFLIPFSKSQSMLSGQVPPYPDLCFGAFSSSVLFSPFLIQLDSLATQDKNNSMEICIDTVNNIVSDPNN